MYCKSEREKIKKKLLFNINDEYVIYNLWLFYIFTAIVRKGMNNYETKLTRLCIYSSIKLLL